MLRKLTALAGALALAGPSVASAQTIRGQVMERTSGTAVGAGFVLLLSSEGKEIARTLADREGRFAIRAPAPGRYRLRSERIGFTATTSPTMEIAAGETRDYRLEISAVAIRLEEIRVAGETRCRVRPEEGRATATVWDEARKALAAVVWVQGQRHRVRLRTYERDLTPELRVLRERSTVKSGSATRPFRAATPAQLASRGYIEVEADGNYLFHAPDADVLFSDEFLNRHCFRLEPVRDPSTAGMIGLGFEPVDGSRISDIEGVMWLDEKNAELRYVDFRYTNHGLPVESELFGGRVEFLRLSNGGWIVSRFRVRMPMLELVKERRYSSVRDAMRGGGLEDSHAALRGLRESGGEVLDAFGSDGTSLASFFGATMAGTIYDSTRGVPLIGAEVRLAGTDHAALSGPGGAFRLEGLPEGDYSVEFTHRDFPQWGVLQGPSFVGLRRGVETQVSMVVPSPAGLFKLLCPGIKGDTTGAVAGILRDSATARPIRDAVIQVSWKVYDVVRSDAFSGRRLGIESGSDSTGYFRTCGVPANLPIQAVVQVRGTEGEPGPEFRVLPGELKELNLRH